MIALYQKSSCNVKEIAFWTLEWCHEIVSISCFLESLWVILFEGTFIHQRIIKVPYLQNRERVKFVLNETPAMPRVSALLLIVRTTTQIAAYDSE
jgi:hypothetical protein